MFVVLAKKKDIESRLVAVTEGLIYVTLRVGVAKFREILDIRDPHYPPAIKITSASFTLGAFTSLDSWETITAPRKWADYFHQMVQSAEDSSKG